MAQLLAFVRSESWDLTRIAVTYSNRGMSHGKSKMSQRYTFSQYSASEAEQVSGIGSAMQRDWRRRGFLPAHPGHARFDLFSLAKLTAFALLAGRGIGPTQARSVVEDTAWGIAYFALGWPDAYDSSKIWPEPTSSWDEAANIHRARILGTHGKLPNALRYLIWWADDSHAYTNSLDTAFEVTTSADPRVQAGIVVLDLEAAGSNLAGRAVRSLVHVDEPAAPSPLDQPSSPARSLRNETIACPI